MKWTPCQTRTVASFNICGFLLNLILPYIYEGESFLPWSKSALLPWATGQHNMTKFHEIWIQNEYDWSSHYNYIKNPNAIAVISNYELNVDVKI